MVKVMLSVLLKGTYLHRFLAQAVAIPGTGLLTVALGLLAFRLVGKDAGAVPGAVLAVKMIAYVGVATVAAALPSNCDAAQRAARGLPEAPTPEQVEP